MNEARTLLEITRSSESRVVGMDEYTEAAVGSAATLSVMTEEEYRRRWPGAFSSAKPTPYEQSEMCSSKIEQDRQASPEALYNGRQPYYPINHERAEHRVVIFLKAEGKPNVEIAKLTGLSPVTVSNIVRQPWAQTRILEIIHQKGGDAVQSLLQGAAADAVARLITEMDSADAARDRITAADKVLDRIYGKPNQSIVHHQGVDLNSLPDEELAKHIPATNGTGSTGAAEATSTP